MNLFYTILLSLFFHFVAFAQSETVYTLTGEESEIVDTLSVLPDKSYTFEQILSDTMLQFVASDSLQSDLADAYWIRVKVKNPSVYAEKYMAEFLPMLDNTLYHYDENEKKWISCSNGLLVNNRERNIWLMPCVLQGKQTTTLYIKTNIKSFKGSKVPVPAVLWLEKERYVAKNEQFIALATYVTIFVFVLFLLYNAYISFLLKDETNRYYLIAQIGGLIYILADQFYFNVLLPFRFCVADATADRFVLFHDVNLGATDLAITMILFGYVQITRIYLETPNLMPKQDKLLKYLLGTYLIAALTNNILIFSKAITLVKNAYLVTTILTISIVLMIIYIAILSYLRKYKLARYFLIANSISISIILGSSFFSLFVDVFRTTDHALFAKVAVIAQAFCLALALAQRVLVIREELKQKQLEAQELIFQNELILSENQLHQVQNELLQEKLEANQRELTSNTLYIYQKNELLAGLKTHIQALSKTAPTTAKETIKSIEAVIQNNLYLDDDWERFRIHFEQVHPDFFKNLQVEHPTLTKNETRLCAYFHINLSTKEIAAMLNIDPASVRKAKMRLNKKMNKEENISENE